MAAGKRLRRKPTSAAMAAPSGLRDRHAAHRAAGGRSAAAAVHRAVGPPRPGAERPGPSPRAGGRRLRREGCGATVAGSRCRHPCAGRAARAARRPSHPHPHRCRARRQQRDAVQHPARIGVARGRILRTERQLGQIERGRAPYAPGAPVAAHAAHQRGDARRGHRSQDQRKVRIEQARQSPRWRCPARRACRPRRRTCPVPRAKLAGRAATLAAGRARRTARCTAPACRSRAPAASPQERRTPTPARTTARQRRTCAWPARDRPSSRRKLQKTAADIAAADPEGHAVAIQTAQHAQVASTAVAAERSAKPRSRCSTF